MAEESYNQKSQEYEHKPTVGAEGAVESKDRGIFDFLGKKEEEKPQHQDHEVITSQFGKVQVSEQPEAPKVEEHKEKEKEEEEKKPGLLEKLHRSNSSSSSSSDENEGDDEETKKKKREKKGLKEKLKEKLSGEKEEEKHEDTTVPQQQEQALHPEENKGFISKIKEKLPGYHKKPEEHHDQVPSPTPSTAPHVEQHVTAESHEGEAKEKKGIMEKIKEKLPGYHPKSDEEKEIKKESDAH